MVIKVGQEVMVTGYFRKPTLGVVTEVKRVWITVAVGERATPCRYRLDDQTDGGNIGVPGRFWTLDQWAQRERDNAAAAYLKEQGIYLDGASPWRNREYRLAEILRKGVMEGQDL